MNAIAFFTGPELNDLGLLILRCILGTFFILARFRWVYDPSRPKEPFLNTARHEHFSNRLCTCGYGSHPALCAFVAMTEILAGIALCVGLFTELALLGLLSVLLFATYCTAREKVMAQSPVDRADCISCYLWRVEGVYIAVCLTLLLSGPGALSLDHFLLGA